MQSTCATGPRLIKRVFHLLTFGGTLAFACLANAPAFASELEAVFERLMYSPDDPALNAEYARLAEESGELRKALQAYARVLASDPENEKAKAEYNRIRAQLQPPITFVRTEAGASYMSNPRQLPGNEKQDETAIFDARLFVYDDRPFMQRRWRSFISLYGDYYTDVSELNNARLSVYSGPIFDLGTEMKLHFAPGGSFATLDDDWLYGEGAIRLSLIGKYNGVRQSVSVHTGYRDVNSDFSLSDGFFINVTGHFAQKSVIRENDGFYFFPRFRYSDPTGDGPGRIFFNPIYPGDFSEYGSRFAYFFPTLANFVHIGFGFGAYWRDYDQNVAFRTDKRQDVYLEPTAHLIFEKVFESPFDLRFDYRFEHNDSNDPTEEFENHIAGTRVIRRF